MRDEPNVTHTTLGFLPGVLIGAFFGVIVGSIIIVGNGIWSAAKYWGYEQCKMEIRLGREP